MKTSQPDQNIRCAIYARCASAKQGVESCEVDAQIRQCRKYAGEKGWTVVEECVRADVGGSGASLAGREALGSLLSAVQQSPRPFDCVLATDLARFGRSLGDVLRLCDVLQSHGVFMHFAGEGLDLRDPAFRLITVMHALMDEQYLSALRSKIHRGQEGRVLQGRQAGGICYGYRSAPCLGTGSHDCNPIGNRLEIVSREADIVRQIFQMYASGKTVGAIARKLNDDRLHSPRASRKGSTHGAWRSSVVRAILGNEKYHGVSIWNRTRRVRNPETARVEVKPRVQSEWVRVEVPELRIVSEGIWEKVQRRIRIATDRAN
jgi:site-specific DNA recombinase